MVEAGHVCHNSSLIRLRGAQDVCRERRGAKEQLHEVMVAIVYDGGKFKYYKETQVVFIC